MSVDHYLLTVPFGVGMHLHAYVITNSRDILAGVMDKMFQVIEQDLGERVMMPIVLQTTLGDGVNVVRGIISKDAKVARHLATVKDFHLTVFGMHESNPDDVRLMALH